MVLDDVADTTNLVIKLAAPGNAEILGHGDLHALDIGAVPDRFEKGIGEAEIEQVLHRLLAKEVVDAENRRFLEYGAEHPVQGLGRCQVMSERLFHHQACSLRQCPRT